MGISDLISGMRRRAMLTKEISDQDIAETKVAERKLSANERLLNHMLKQEREENIKRELERRTKKEEKEYWHKDVISQKNLFTEKNGNSLLKQHNLFGAGK